MDQSFYETGIAAEQARYDELARAEDAARIVFADTENTDDINDPT